MTIVILGCGYTGERVARKMLARGARVICTTREPERLRGLVGAEIVRLDLPADAELAFVPAGSRVLYSIPPVGSNDEDWIAKALAERRPARVVYLSTTGVYGDQQDVDERTPASPRNEHDRQRIAVEASVQQGPWSSIVLRPAAIYGPDRGVHISMQQGRFRLVGEGGNFVSRIHVDDLASHVAAALLTEVEGAWPVADDYPCTSREIAAYCAERFGVPMPSSMPASEAHHTRTANRRVDGSAVRRALGVELEYPDFRAGIAASAA